MMKIDIITLFPDMCDTVLSESIIGRASAKGLLELKTHYIRDYTADKHGRCDDAIYGGGMGMLMQAQPIFDCYQSVTAGLVQKPHTIYMSPKGSTFTQKKAIELAERQHIVILCGHYEGVDERVLDEIVDEEISIGDYVLTGGELPALVVADAVSRMVDGVLSDAICFTEESHFAGLLEYPQYSRPAIWNGREVPQVLLSGNHAEIDKWRREQSLMITKKKRPELLENANLSDEDKQFLANISDKE